jgi:hypothetical protein
MYDITIVGIDGLGTEIDSYIRIFDLCFREFKYRKGIIFTSANGYHVDMPDGVDIDFIQIPKLSYKEFNCFCLLNVAQFINTTHALFVQSDGFICNGKNWNDEFYQYDYIGNPWIVDKETNQFPSFVKSYEDSVGNGGFSLRSKRIMDLVSQFNPEMIKSLVYGGTNEDVFISSVARDFLKNNGCKYAPPELAKKFSSAYKIDGDILENSFGFHSPEFVDEALELYKIRYGCDYSNDIVTLNTHKN